MLFSQRKGFEVYGYEEKRINKGRYENET